MLTMTIELPAIDGLELMRVDETSMGCQTEMIAQEERRVFHILKPSGI